MRSQAQRFDAELRTAKVSRIDVTPWPFELWVGDPAAEEPTVLADALIVATGARSLMLGVPNEVRLIGYGVSTCATCDGFFFREQPVAVAGGGDSAMEEAIFLTRFASKVTVVHRRDELRASKIMQERAFANPKIEFAWNSTVTEILGDTKVSGLRLQDTVSGAISELPVNGFFVAIGHEPNSALLKGQLELEGQRVRQDVRRHDPDQRRRRLRLRRRPGPLLPPGGDLGRVRLHGRHRRRALARGAGRVAGNRWLGCGVAPADKEM